MSETVISRGPFEERRLAAIVFTDVVGYSARMQKDEAGTLALVQADFERIGKVCTEHGGEILNTMGDGLLLCFPSAVQAVACALQVQAEFGQRKARLPAKLALEHRIGIHLGDVFRQAGGVVGDGVNIAARLQTKAPAGGISISQTVNDTVKGKLAMQSVYIGPQSFKNLSEPINVFNLTPEGMTAAETSRWSSVVQAARKGWQRRLVLTTGWLLALALLGAVGGYLWTQRPKKLTAESAFSNDAMKNGHVLVAEFENRTGEAASAGLGKILADRVRQGAPQISWVHSAASAPPGLAQPEETTAALQGLGTKHQADVLVTGAYYLQGGRLHLTGRVFDLRHGAVFADLAPVVGPAADSAAALEEFPQRLLGAIDTLGLTRLAAPVAAEKMYQLSCPPRLDARDAMRAGLESNIPLETRLQHLRRSYAIDPQGCLGALVWQAVVLVDAGRYAEADGVVQQAEKFPERLTPYFRAALSWAKAALDGDVPGLLESATTARHISQGSFIWIEKAARALLYANRPRKFLEMVTLPEPAQSFVDRVPETWIGRACAYNLLGDRERELAAARRAHELDPENLVPLALLARAQAALGQTTEVRTTIEKAQEQKATAEAYPGLVMLAALAEYQLTGQTAARDALMKDTLLWYAGRSPHELAQEKVRYDLARLHGFAGRWDQAHALATALRKDFPAAIAYLGLLGVCEGRLGRRARAEEILTELRTLDPKYRFGEQLYLQARLAAVLGRPDEALTWLREAMGQRSVAVPRFGLEFVRVEPDFESLRTLPAFQAILAPRG